MNTYVCSANVFDQIKKYCKKLVLATVLWDIFQKFCVCFVYFLFAPYACDVHSLRENHKALKCHILPSQLPCKLFSDLLAQVSWNILQDIVFVHVGCKPCGHVDFSTIDELSSEVI